MLVVGYTNLGHANVCEHLRRTVQKCYSQYLKQFCASEYTNSSNIETSGRIFKAVNILPKYLNRVEITTASQINSTKYHTAIDY